MGKAEFMNPGGSVKDRAAWGLVQWAEKNGKSLTLRAVGEFTEDGGRGRTRVEEVFVVVAL